MSEDQKETICAGNQLVYSWIRDAVKYVQQLEIDNIKLQSDQENRKEHHPFINHRVAQKIDNKSSLWFGTVKYFEYPWYKVRFDKWS